MTIDQITAQRKTISQLLSQRRLKEALTQLQAMLFESGLYQVESDLEEISRSYDLMLKYFKDGMEDPYRDRLFKKLLEETWDLLDKASVLLVEKRSNLLIFERRSMLKGKAGAQDLRDVIQSLRGYSYHMETLLARGAAKEEAVHEASMHDKALARLFDILWTTSFWESAFKEILLDMLEDVDIIASDQALAVSAATLSLTQTYDTMKMQWIISACRSHQPLVSQRAMVGLLMALRIWKDRLKLDKDIRLLVDELLLEEDIVQGMTAMLTQILRSKDTTRIQKKVREEIMPSMIQGMRDFSGARGKEDSEDDPVLSVDPDSELGKKMQKMNALQMEGADLYMDTFQQFKGFDFFHQIHHWMLPYTDLTEQSIAAFSLEPKGEDKSIQAFIAYGMFCDSDKFSMLSLLPHLPKGQIKNMFSQMDPEQMQELIQSGEGSLKEYNDKKESIFRRYVQDLYRFFRLFARRTEFDNPFTLDWDYKLVPCLKDHISQDSVLLNAIADYLFSKGHFKESAAIYQEMMESGLSLASTAQKAGYALEKTGQYQEAIKVYLTQLDDEGRRQWTLRHLSSCYKKTGKFQKAVECYQAIISEHPENLDIIYDKALCQIEMRKYEDALKTFFQLDYQEPDSQRAMRGIVWCCMTLGRDDQAFTYLSRLQTLEKGALDDLYMGHHHLIGGRISDSVESYQRSLEKAGSIEDFRKMVLQDEEMLRTRGVSGNTLQMVLDLMF